MDTDHYDEPDERDQNLADGGTSHGTEVVDLSFPPGWKADTPHLAAETAVDAGASVTTTVVRASNDPPVPRETTTSPDRLPTDPGLRRAALREQARDAAPTDTPSEDTDPTATLLPLHRLGQTVWFRSRTGAWTAPAVITATIDSLNRDNVTVGHVPDLSSADHVHLTVFTPGIQGHVSDSTAAAHPELVADDRPNKPAGGSFQEWDIAYWSPSDDDIDQAAFQIDGPVESAFPAGFDFSVQPAGTWMWPL